MSRPALLAALALLLAAPAPAASPLASGAAWSSTGTANAYFGESADCAGDVNGDGYQDLIISAYGAGGNLGAAFIYLGGPGGLSTTAAWGVSGSAATGDYLGTMVAGVGDVNKDGYADVVVSSQGDSSNAGAAFLYLGGLGGPSASFAWSASGSGGSDFGSSLAHGDFNGDGYQDVAIAASSGGTVSVFLGGPSGLAASPAWTVSPGAGVNVASGHDLNKDGYDDLIVGAPGAGSAGQAWIYLGSASGLPLTPSQVLDGASLGASSPFGSTVAGAGDVNGDAYADALVASSGGNGQVWLFLGQPGGVSAASAWTRTGPSPGSGFGVHLGAAGDLDKDGYGDVWVGSNALSVFVYNGGPLGLSAAPSWTQSGPAGSALGYVAAGSGDIDGSGHSNLLVTAYRASAHAGEAYLFAGLIAPTPTVTPTPGPAASLAGVDDSRIYPSPVRGPGCRIALTLSAPADVRVEIHNGAGDLACVVEQAGLGAGAQSLAIDSSRFATGAYFYLVRLTLAGGAQRTLPLGKFMVVH